MPNFTKPQDHELPQPIQRALSAVDPLLARHALKGHVAKVALILDWSGSMRELYESKDIQHLVNRFAALAHRFDDDGQIDLFAYHSTGSYIGQFGALDCAEGGISIEDRIREVMGGFGGTDYASGFRAFRKQAFGSSGERHNALKQALPWYVGFITDGQNQGSIRDCIAQIQSLSFEPAFIQSIALGADYDSREGAHNGGSLSRFFGMRSQSGVPIEFEFLARLDSNVPGRFIDNSNFFATTHPNALPDKEFFDRMMGEYPSWLKLAKEKGLIS